MNLSVVIPTFNTAAMTLRCCRAVTGAFEVIVVDDGSSDGTAALLARDVPHVRIIKLDVNRGFGVAANCGVSEAKGDAILLLNSDAIVDANTLPAFLDAFERDAKLGVAGAQLLNEDGSPQWSGGAAPTLLWIIAAVTGLGRFARFFRRQSSEPRTQVDWVSGAAMAFRAEVWRDAGPLSERYRFYCQDLEFCLRARDAGWDVRIVDGARVVHGHGRTIAPNHPRKHDPVRLRDDLLAWGTARYGKAWGLVATVILKAIRRT